jgi:hypothetical protein
VFETCGTQPSVCSLLCSLPILLSFLAPDCVVEIEATHLTNTFVFKWLSIDSKRKTLCSRCVLWTVDCGGRRRTRSLDIILYK